MSTRKLSILVAFFYAAIQLQGQVAPAPVRTDNTAPRVELQLNYNYLYANVVHSDHFSLNGANAEAVVNLGRRWGLMADFSGATASDILGSTQNLNLYNFHFGARYSFRNQTRFTPYLQGLVGASKLTSNYPIYANGPVVFGSTAGGGLTMRMTPHFGLTLVEADWVRTQGMNGDQNNQNDLRLAAGLYLRFGHVGNTIMHSVPPTPLVDMAPPPVSIVCAVTPATVNAGEVVHLRAQNLQSGMEYAWTSTGGLVSGNGENATVDTTGLDGGTYTATVGHASGDTRIGDCTSSFTVRYHPHERAEVAPPVRDDSADRRAQLASQLNAVQKTTESARGLNIILNSVLFNTGKYDLTPTAESVLSRVASILKQHPDLEIHVEGHTDSVGGAESNQRLSENRARAVKDFLVRNGLSATNITAAGYGENHPVASNETVAGRAQNRRVDIFLSGDAIGVHYREP